MLQQNDVVCGGANWAKTTMAYLLETTNCGYIFSSMLNSLSLKFLCSLNIPTFVQMHITQYLILIITVSAISLNVLTILKTLPSKKDLREFILISTAT